MKETEYDVEELRKREYPMLEGKNELSLDSILFIVI